MTDFVQRSFTSGEIAPALRSRTDLAKYASGLALSENGFPRAQGGWYSRPGFRFVGELDDSTKRGRLIPFSFNTEQTYTLVFEHLKMFVVKDGGFVLSGGTPYSIATPYTEAQLSLLKFTQNADVMTIVHLDHDDRDLSRTADDAWTLAVNNYASTVTAPSWASVLSYNITGITQANPAVVTTSITHALVSGNTVSITGVVGMVEVNNRSFIVRNPTATTFELEDEDSTSHTAYTSGGTVSKAILTAVGSGAGSYNKTYTYVVTAVDGDGVESLASASASITTASLSVTAGVRLSWATVAGTDYYRVYKDPSNNTGRYGWIGDSNSLEFDDYNIAPITSDAPPEDRQPFTGAGNHPSAVNYYQQRKVFANTGDEPQAVYTTQTGNPKSLRTSSPARDTDAVTFTIAARQVNEIRHIVALDALILLTSGGEWLVSEGQDDVLTPSTPGAQIQSYNGASHVPPAIVNDTVLYVQEKGGRIRDLGYEFSNDKYTGDDLSIMAEHLFEDRVIEEMFYAAEPYSILWCVMDDGVMLGLTYHRKHQVVAWHQHNTQGTFESVISITEGTRDAVYVIVKRTINGSVVRYVERMEPRYVTEPADVFCVDSGLSYDNPSTITGASKTNPVVVDDVGHGYLNGDAIDIVEVVGMTELNGGRYLVANKTTDAYELTNEEGVNIDGTSFTTYVSGGESRKAITTVTGATHLLNTSVAVVADGVEVSDLVVNSSGEITLPRAASRVHLGLAYTPAMELLDIDTPSNIDPVKGKKVSVSSVTLEVEKSRGGWVGPINDDGVANMTEIEPRYESDGYDAIALKTFKQEVIIQPEWNKSGGVRIEQRSPFPLAILSVIPDVDVGG